MPSNPEKETLEKTLQRAAGGDEDAWRTIIESYSGRVFGLIRSQCGNADLAEEITQSVFCTMAEKIVGYTESGRFESWLFRIAINRLRDEMRRRKRHARPVEEEKLIGMAGAIEVEPDRDDARRQDTGALREAMAQLPEADQRIVYLRHYGELSFRQIADILDQPLGTVLARQHRALKKLRDLLEGKVREDGIEQDEP
ncbi:MAG: RNA polymerase sigma factor [Planctomycetes bacterium]|nr:RNA polymerase sigma factor [Planctomycetota bacterium]